MEKNDWFETLRVKGMTDYAGHYVEMKEVDKNQKVWWYWNDGAITNEGFKRDKLFNFLYLIVKFLRFNKFLIKVFITFCVLYGCCLVGMWLRRIF